MTARVLQSGRPWPDLGVGVGLRAEHYTDVLADPSRAEWYEAISENFMDTHGRPLAVLERVRSERPVVLHGVGLSIGSADPLNPVYLERLKRLIDRIEPAIVSDHLCWTGIDGMSLFDLLPLPYTEETLAYVVERVARVQDVLGRRILLENASTYVEFCESQIPEAEFLATLAERADCGILLDVNNVYVSATNHGWDARAYIDAMPRDRVGQIHLAGHSDMHGWLFDTHSAPVCDAVWELYAYAIERLGPVATLIEWDESIPPFEELLTEAERARALWENARAEHLHSTATAPAG